MVIDLLTQEYQSFANFKGGEGHLDAKMNFDGVNRILQGRLEKGCSIGMHTHETNSEIIYFISGQVKMIMDGVEETLTAGQCHYCPKGHTHTMINDNDEPAVFFAVVPEQ